MKILPPIHVFKTLSPAVEALGLEAIDWRVLGEDFIAISQTKAGSSFVLILLILIIARRWDYPIPC